MNKRVMLESHATNKRKAPRTRESESILLVEDHEDIAFFLMHWLKRQGWKPVWAETTAEALNLVHDASFIEAPFHGLLSDFRLPDATGCRVVSAFREEFPGQPAAIMTAYYDLSMELWARSNGLPLFRKPLDLPVLRRWLRGS